MFATASAAQRAFVESLGATFIDYRAGTVEAWLDVRTGGQGFDVVYDTVGGSSLDQSFAAVRRYSGHALSILGWGTHSLAPLSFRSVIYSGVFTPLPMITGEGREACGAS